ncbi:amino acid ABC transporter permease [Aquibaculum arenosum]|uniref:Amino acid ABC transporter permease n=1 Tax=Aquibaculum arenosum TaxID=3032591 RepID=A0ABT5YNM5_9PROT|nr:amino acid ABC transporter permease [Fodinicurvata sp. CAU 1616]MDF2095844.1 amino acid ABC transporter permease [Fodinicurvata sp. CAU 1616]
MAVDSDRGASASSKTPFWYDPRFRAIFFQILTVVLVVAGIGYLVSNVMTNLERQNIASGFGFLQREAGFAIAESMVSYSAADTYGRAFIVGILNTFRVALLGIVLATIIGVLVGVARLSTNWLIAKLASVYIEVLRNIPLLLQLFIWYGVITVSLPGPRQAMSPVEGIYLSNRGFMIPAPVADPIHAYMGIAALLALAAGYLIRRWAKQRQIDTGKQFPVYKTSLGLLILFPAIAWVLGGAPTVMELPTLQGFNFRGGLTLTPEFAALLFGLTFYTAAFIAEIVRGGILAVSHGQSEAAFALGLRKGMVLRFIVLPQALRIIIPPTTSQYLNLTKNSSLAVAIGYPDLVSVGNTTLNQTGQAIEAITIFMAVYLTLSLTISLIMNWYNRAIALVER